MKKSIVRNFGVALTALMMLILGACKKETVDVTDLLKTVPSSVSGVIVINMEGLLKDAGCKIKDHEVIPSPEIEQLLAKAGERDREDFKVLFDGSTGIEPKGAVVFYDTNRTFLTFALCDVKKFTDFVESKAGVQFTDEGNGVKVCGTTAIVGSQAWVCISSGRSIDPDAILSYSKLAVSQSFLVTDMGEELLTEEDDVRGWALINVFANEMMGRAESGSVTMGLGFLFDDAESVKFKADFKKGEIEAEAVVLNDKFKPAKYLLPADKVDVNTLKSLGVNCNVMMAFTVNQKLVKKFNQVGQMFGGALFGDLNETFKNVDGTIGLISQGESFGSDLAGVVTVKGDASKTLKDLISTLIAPVSEDGKYLRFSAGTVGGNLSVAECADELKGSCMGIVADPSGINNLGYGSSSSNGFKCIVAKFKPESGGLEFELEIKTSNPDENSLLTVLRNQ